MDYSTLPKASAIPGAAAMIETFRAIGYSLETAVADIIDNSISAKAKNVWGIERSGFFNGREKWAKGFENQRV